jgi:lipoprotein-anchoring transpeptidase ErfK/SrfK
MSFYGAFFLAALVLQAPTSSSVPAPESSQVPLTVDDAGAAVLAHDLALHSAGPQVLRVSILLDRMKFSPGEIDGIFGNNLARTVTAFRRAHQLPLDPVVDQAVWNLLNAGAGPLFVPYTITKQDVRGPYNPVPAAILGKAQLKRLGYESVEEMLGERFHVNPKVLAALNPGKDLHAAGTVINVPDVLTPAPPRPASLCVNGTDLTLQGLDAAGHILMSYPVSVGSKHDPLPVGQWQVAAIHPYPVYTYDSIHFWDASGPRTKAHVAPGPNNPVGVVWIGLSKNHYGIHGTPSPGLIGRGQSHGCIRMTNWDATELSTVIQPGLNVVLKTE